MCDGYVVMMLAGFHISQFFFFFFFSPIRHTKRRRSQSSKFLTNSNRKNADMTYYLSIYLSIVNPFIHSFIHSFDPSEFFDDDDSFATTKPV